MILLSSIRKKLKREKASEIEERKSAIFFVRISKKMRRKRNEWLKRGSQMVNERSRKKGTRYHH